MSLNSLIELSSHAIAAVVPIVIICRTQTGKCGGKSSTSSDEIGFVTCEVIANHIETVRRKELCATTRTVFTMCLADIDPPLVNSANPWATTSDDLQALFDCEALGAITIRTSLLAGFQHDHSIHQYTFFNPVNQALEGNGDTSHALSGSGSLNTLGYSPIILDAYLAMIPEIVARSTLPTGIRDKKPIIVSVTGSAEAVRECYRKIAAAQDHVTNPLCMEVNLSCPNIPDKPPPAYSSSSLSEYLSLLASDRSSNEHRKVLIGIKTPPYTYHDQFKTLIDALVESSTQSCPVDFITATNTLGSSLVLNDTGASPALNSASGAGIGGMAGAPLHPLALGNVKILREMMDQHRELRDVEIIGVGGVSDNAGFKRMRAVGARVVGVGTALGKNGVKIFHHILNGE